MCCSGPQKSLLFLRDSLMAYSCKLRYSLASLLGPFLLRNTTQCNGTTETLPTSSGRLEMNWTFTGMFGASDMI